MPDDTPAIDASEKPARQRPLGQVDQSFYLISVGASAGGLDAIKQLISQVPRSFAHSFVVIQHISPDYKSLMAEILGRETTLKVCEVEDDMPVEPRHIYLIPPRANVVIQGTNDDNRAELDTGAAAAVNAGLRFSLVDPSPRPGLNLPIDLFFHSLAEAVRDRGVGIILSGTGSDGSRGLRAIKDYDGFVVVQDPATAAFDGMPRAGIDTGIVDLVLPPDAMIAELVRYFEMRESGIMNIDDLFKGAEDDFQSILELVSDKAEIDFTQYKEPTLKRRLARRMVLRNCETISEYLKHIEENGSEQFVLYREFLVGVTNFFRDMPVWNTLEELCLPELFETGDPSVPLKIWSVGCSTGEEAYSIAALLQKYRRANRIEREFRVFASDVNETAILAAKEGIYPDTVCEEIPRDLLESDLFSFHPSTVHVSQEIRSRVVFAHHNVMDDAPYIHTDLIICRNMLIYLGPDVQSKILALFSFSLRRGGFLLLGAAEHTAQSSSAFDVVDARSRIYRNVRKANRNLSRNMLDRQFPALPSGSPLPRARRLSTRDHSRQSPPLSALLRLVLARIEACIFIVDESAMVIETFGEYRDIVQMPEQAFSANLLDLVNNRLRSTISLLMRRADGEGQFEKTGVRLPYGEGTRLYDVFCQKTEWNTHTNAYSLVFCRADHRQSNANPAQTRGDTDMPRDLQIEQLESEIETLQEMLSATAEDLGISNEELQTTNEELVASNEELQANNEEMQSINEELHTVNAENSEKIQQLEAANTDIENLLDNVELGILILDLNLRIRRFSNGIRRYVELEDSDIGRRFENFTITLQHRDAVKLLEDVAAVRESGKSTTHEVRREDGGWAVVRTRPYLNTQGRTEGVVIKIHDTTSLKLLQDEVRQQRDRLEGLLESEAAGYWDWHIPAHTEYMSPRFKSMFGYEDDEIENSPDAWQRLIHPDDLPGVLKTFNAHVKSRGKVPYDNEVRYFHKDGSTVWVLCRGRVVEWGEDGEPLRMMGVHIDITHLKEREEAARRQTRAAE